MIYEIFNSVDGTTHGYRSDEAKAEKFCNSLGGLIDEASGKQIYYDFLPARCGFYVLDMRNAIKAGPFATRTDAERKSDFENQSSDTNSFHVYEQVN